MMQTEEEEHGSVLSIAEVDKLSALGCRYHLAKKPDEREENLEETFPLPATQCHRTAADEVHRERHAGLELDAGLDT